MGADIISMSWTYKRELDSNDNDKREFETLVEKTLEKNKAILFGSHPDLGPTIEVSHFAPVSLPGIIRICSATPAGGVSEKNLHANPSFLLPGEEIAMPDVWEGKVKGSSFATAYAAGLAALVLYSVRSYRELCIEDNDGDLETAERELQVVKKHQGMRKVFRILAGQEPEGQAARNCFVRPNSQLRDDKDPDRYPKKHLRDTLVAIIPRKISDARFSDATMLE